MRKFFICIFIVSNMAGFSQSGDSAKKGFGKRKLITNSTTVEKLKKIKDSTINAVSTTDENKIQQDISRNMDSLARLKEEKKVKQKNSSMIRIAIGLSLLAILIIGIRRKRR